MISIFARQSLFDNMMHAILIRVMGACQISSCSTSLSILKVEVSSISLLVTSVTHLTSLDLILKIHDELSSGIPATLKCFLKQAS